MANKTYIVYCHTTPSGKRYFGITFQKPQDRWDGGNGYSHQVFYNAIQKYGWDNIRHEILYSGLGEEEAKQIEIQLIAEYRTTDPDYGYNVSSGGAGHTFNDIGKKRVSEGLMKYFDEHPEARTHLSDFRKRYYKEHPEAIELLRQQHTGHKVSDKARAKMSASHKGRTFSEETKAKISSAKKGWVPSETTRKNMSNAAKERQKRRENPEVQNTILRDNAAKKRKPIIATNKVTGEKMRFDSILEAAQILDIKHPHISRCLKGGRPSTGGYTFEYATKGGEREE